jgi:hypothetical protein
MSAVMPSTSTDNAWRELHEAATVPYKKGGTFAWQFARGKLGRDPVFRGLLERGLIGAQHRRVVDIGCGQGLFASLLASMSAMQQQGRWPRHGRHAGRRRLHRHRADAQGRGARRRRLSAICSRRRAWCAPTCARPPCPTATWS